MYCTVSRINYEYYEDIWKMFQNKLKINDKQSQISFVACILSPADN